MFNTNILIHFGLVDLGLQIYFGFLTFKRKEKCLSYFHIHSPMQFLLILIFNVYFKDFLFVCLLLYE